MANQYEDKELREAIGSIKIARNTRSETFYTLAGHDEFENIMQLITQKQLEARIDEDRLVAVGLTAVLSPDEYKKYLVFMNARYAELTKQENTQ
jgi:hypothetical protein